MRIQIESTTKIVTLDGVQMRVWEGATESGIPVICMVARVAVENSRPPEDHAQFERELQEMKPPSAAAEWFPHRMIS
jgi:hypothetical protein